MDLNSKAIHDIIHPTAAFSQLLKQQGLRSGKDGRDFPVSWDSSQLNPKNRIDSLDPPPNPLWRIDGSAGLGTQYYAIPKFVDRVPPMRFDVFIPEEAMESPMLRELLDLDVAFHTRNSARLARLGICNHVLRILQHWTATGGEGSRDAVTGMFESLPFGSRIIFENLDVDVRKVKVSIAPAYFVERQLLTVSSLSLMWGMPAESFPGTVDISDLEFAQQLHDSVCVVRMRSGSDAAVRRDGKDDRQLYILKALISGTKYLYHELRVLLSMQPHPNVISRPTYLATKRCLFGGKTAVAGFILPYHTGGSMSYELPYRRAHGLLTPVIQVRWAMQLASAVLHIFERAKIFYPDQRLDNIVLSAAGDAVMVDFEQRGVWCEFAAPEVNALDYVRILASNDADQFRFQPSVPEAARARYAAMLDRYLPGWEALKARETYEYPLPGGIGSYNVAWECLDTREREAAAVYMLGRVLWCVFEGTSAPERAAAWQSFPWEPEVQFPGYVRTPPALRRLVEQCTRGRRTLLSSVVVRRKSKMVLATDDGGGRQSPERVLAAAKAWWTAEIKYAEEFLLTREERKANGTWESNHFGRPSLREVVAALEAYKEEAGVN